ncbi:MAG: alanine--tRNA ligase-related protein [Candidatus Dojkabacteria bacterium]|nr:alanine--tRNA ligase-related protein [Candidatus Dojkabacteria bacterium]
MTEHLKGECYEDISTKITDFYNSKGLDYREPLSLIPGENDKSVTFTSATINNFKGYLREEEEIPVNGVYTIQNCLRTRNLDYRYGFEETPRFGSYFRMFGLIRRPNFLLKTYADTIEFIESELGVPSESIVVHKSSEHDMFNELMKKNSKQRWFEDKIDWYNWEYGEEDIRGEGISIEIPNKSNLAETQVIGNIVVIYKKDEPIAVEWGFGLETTMSRLEGLPHPIFSSVIGERYLYKNNHHINEKDILFLDYTNILYHLEANDVKQGRDKYVDRTIKQLFQGLSMQIFLTLRNISDLEDLIGRKKDGLFEEFEGYNDSFQERVSLFLNSYKQIVSNYAGRRSEKKIEETINKSAQKYGFNKEQKETLINFRNSLNEESLS